MRTILFVAATIALVVSGGFAFAEDAVDPTAVKSEDGKYLDKEGNPTFKVAPDGTVGASGDGFAKVSSLQVRWPLRLRLQEVSAP